MDNKAETLVDDLYKFNEDFVANFGVEKLASKSAMLRAETDKTVAELKAIESSCLPTPYLMQYGRALNVLDGYSQECEMSLSKVVKRDPSRIDAWNMLGECYWKKGDIAAARNCFQGALRRSKNKVSLRSMSMVLRQLKEEHGEGNQVVASVTCAKDALQLDMDDGVSWYVLGNAYLSLFFCTQQNSKVLTLALNSYTKAETVKANSKHNPDLHFNRAQAYRYKEEYHSALTGWACACELDPSWNEPKQKIDDLIKYLNKITNLIELKGKLKNRRIQNLVKSFTVNDLGPYNRSKAPEEMKYVSCTLNELEEGVNLGKVISMKVLCNIADMTLVPFTYIAIDSNYEVFAATIFNLNEKAGVIIGDTVVIPNPDLTSHDIEWKANVGADAGSSDLLQWKFKCIRVNKPVDIVVNKSQLTPQHCSYTKACMTASDQAVVASK